jgi:hypothetical protein
VRAASIIRAIIEAARTYEMSVDIELRTRHYIPEDSELHLQILVHKTKKLMYQALVQSILLYWAETWTLNTQQANK